MASQHNRSSTYRALVDGNIPVPSTREEVLHAKYAEGDEDEKKERKPHGLPSEEVLNEELRNMKVKPNGLSSIAGANSNTFDQYRIARRHEIQRVEKMYRHAEDEKRKECFEKRKREREGEQADRTASRAAKRNKKKENKMKRDQEFKAKAKEKKPEEN
eukprot:TRINITY_DN38875_c0_g1_i1.p1 TRINITY_DN38875_c0_g1~~TRINITY_DN38875_c0_g1_i1.p1  ORF type:complete len:159 (+),score=43.37 TRINITY_DN38875_c0_g1_i1:54-530(+)